MTSINNTLNNLLNEKIKIIPNSTLSIDKYINDQKNNIKLIAKIEQRKKILLSLKKFLLKNKKYFIKLINLEVYKTIDESKGEFDYAIEFIDYSLTTLKNYKFEKKNKNRSIFIKSSGLVFAITPYNDPLAGMIRKIAPSIAAGSPIIVKTSSYNLKICKFFDIFLTKDLNKIIKFVFIKDKKIINKIIQNNEIKIVTFTGSTEVGLKINSVPTNHLQKKILELGGINYAIINSKDKLNKIVEEILIRKIKAAGQACSSINKIFVDKKIKKEFEIILKKQAKKLICGSIDKNIQPNFGPVISNKHYKFLLKLKNKLSKKNKLITESKNLMNTNNLFPLTIFNVSFDDEVFDKFETFGPLLGVNYYSNDNKLMNKISSSNYSLVCYIYTKSKKFIDFSINLKFGSIGINTTKIQSPGSPTGGNDLSGIGREGGIWGFEEFLSTVNYVKEKI